MVDTSNGGPDGSKREAPAFFRGLGGIVKPLASATRSLYAWAEPGVSDLLSTIRSQLTGPPEEWTHQGSAPERVHTVTFGSPEGALQATRALREAGFEIKDVYTPFPVHGMDEAMGLRETRLPAATLVGGILGLTLGFGFQAWTHNTGWPLNIGGKSNLAWPALVPIGFEVTVLLAAFATVGALLFRSRLFPQGIGNTPESQPDPRVTDDRFVLMVVERDASFSIERFQELCEQAGAEEVVAGWRVI